jgi:FdhD protein
MVVQSNKLVPITRHQNGTTTDTDDLVAIEEPLEISIVTGGAARTLSITMRTPGHDRQLCAGFLFTEGILGGRPEHLLEVRTTGPNSVLGIISDKAPIEMARLERHFYTTSSCGVCGKTSLEAVMATLPTAITAQKTMLDPTVIVALPDRMRAAQAQFDQTGGIHAAGLFDRNGALQAVFEDVGRHNALDKLVGHFILQQNTAQHSDVLMLSGRASFELLQKAALFGVGTVCAVGAPSSLAVEVANRLNIRLIGFLRGERFNIYS